MEFNRLLIEAIEAPEKPNVKVKGDISHDLRSKLNVIIGFAELLLDEVPGKINEEQRQSLNDIRDNARRVLSLVNNVLDTPGTVSGKKA